jgi:hypothetical protein
MGMVHVPLEPKAKFLFIAAGKLTNKEKSTL